MISYDDKDLQQLANRLSSVPEFWQFISVLQNDTIHALLNTLPEEKEEREAAYHRWGALEEIKNTMNVLNETRKARLRAENG
jgi:hypothetical protein